jgi:hypothetical protein
LRKRTTTGSSLGGGLAPVGGGVKRDIIEWAEGNLEWLVEGDRASVSWDWEWSGK